MNDTLETVAVRYMKAVLDARLLTDKAAYAAALARAEEILQRGARLLDEDRAQREPEGSAL